MANEHRIPEENFEALLDQIEALVRTAPNLMAELNESGVDARAKALNVVVKSGLRSSRHRHFKEIEAEAAIHRRATRRIKRINRY